MQKATIYFKSGNKVTLKVIKCEIKIVDCKKIMDFKPVDKIAWMFDVEQIECIIRRKCWF